jgi:cytochrome c peroxidase
MPLAGTQYNAFLFWDGRKDSQWAQALGPLESAVEHGESRGQYAHTLESFYKEENEALFGALPTNLSEVPDHAGPVADLGARAAWATLSDADRDAVTRMYVNMGKAIAAYERLLLPAACTTCHIGPLLTNGDFHNTGVPERVGLAADSGRAAGAQKVLGDEFNCLSHWSDAKPEDCTALRFLKAGTHEQERQFKVPSLRNVAERGPYMDAGQFATLREVLDHYNTAPPAPAGHSELSSLNLSDAQLRQLEAFLRTLTAVPTEE